MTNTLRIMVVLAAAAVVAGFSAQALAGQYYVVESQSGMVLITDHEPQGNATVLKGPFETREAAQQALSSAEKERLGTPGQGRGQGKGQGKGRGTGRGRNR